MAGGGTQKGLRIEGCTGCSNSSWVGPNSTIRAIHLGYFSIDITVDIYGCLIPNSNREAVNRLDNLHPSALCQKQKATTY
ncbi:MAG: hypothetical protein CL941_08445 [Desulfobacter sp.]|nr:hypothetical protein [Desulfobacter sp.]